MTILSYIAISGCLLVLGLGGVTLFVERGYSFDLRGKGSHPAARRRASDRVPSVR